MRTGLIYKYTNLVNNKVYIGQTTEKIARRYYRHMNQLDDNTYFHRAIKKYGIENFALEIVEDNIPLEELDNREIYWIKYFDSYYTSNKGYNLTKGGQWGTSHQLICGSAEKEIKDLIRDTELTFSQIGSLYGVSLSCISDINTGRTFYEEDRKYPIRTTPQRTQLNTSVVEQIIEMLETSEMSIQDIGTNLGLSDYTIGEINRGKNSWCPKNRSYPIRKGVKKNTYQNKVTQDEVILICKDLIFTSDTLETIGKKFNIAKNTVGDISRGLTWKEVTSQFKLPIRKNKLENQPIYNSIYGIV